MEPPEIDGSQPRPRKKKTKEKNQAPSLAQKGGEHIRQAGETRSRSMSCLITSIFSGWMFFLSPRSFILRTLSHHCSPL